MGRSHFPYEWGGVTSHMNGEESLLYEWGGPAFADGGPDRVGPDGVLRVARMQLIGADPALRPDSRRACGPDVDPREIPRFGFFACDRVESAGEPVDLLCSSVVRGRRRVCPRRNRD